MNKMVLSGFWISCVIIGYLVQWFDISSRLVLFAAATWFGLALVDVVYALVYTSLYSTSRLIATTSAGLTEEMMTLLCTQRTSRFQRQASYGWRM